MTPEGKVKKEGRAICSKVGAFHFPVNQGDGSVRGIPDDCLCLGGRFIFIEYKADMRWNVHNKTAYKTLPTMNQVLRMEECREAGGLTFLVDCKNIDRLERELIQIKYNQELCRSFKTQDPTHGPCVFTMTSREFAEYLSKGLHK